MSVKDKTYCELGKLLDDLTRDRNIRGPYNIAHHLKHATGYEVSGQAVSKYLYGKYVPKRKFIKAFAEAFELTPRERSELAWVYTYDFRPEQARKIDDRGAQKVDRHAFEIYLELAF